MRTPTFIHLPPGFKAKKKYSPDAPGILTFLGRKTDDVDKNLPKAVNPVEGPLQVVPAARETGESSLPNTNVFIAAVNLLHPSGNKHRHGREKNVRDYGLRIRILSNDQHHKRKSSNIQYKQNNASHLHCRSEFSLSLKASLQGKQGKYFFFYLTFKETEAPTS